MKYLFAFVLVCLALTGCSSNTTISTPNVNPAELSGKAENYSGGAGTLEVGSGSGVLLATGPISADGTFKLMLKDPTNTELPLLSDSSMYNCDSMTFSSATAQGASMIDILVLDSKGNFKGWLMQGSSLKTLQNWYAGGASLVGQGITRLYATQDVKVTGKTCNADPDGVNFDFNLKKGWNLITADAKDKNAEYFNTTSLEGINWYFVQEMNF
jgi:hypothetical protein